MDFFEKLSKKATDTYKCMEEKTNKMAVESKIKSKMNDCKSKISVIYNEIGKKVYQKHTTDGLVKIEEDIQEELSRIDELCKEIENCELELLNLAGQKRCIECGETIQIEANFCQSCGAKQPEEENKNEAEDTQAQEEEKAEIEADEENAQVAEEVEIEQFVEEVEPIENDKEEIQQEENEKAKSESEENK